MTDTRGSDEPLRTFDQMANDDGFAGWNGAPGAEVDHRETRRGFLDFGHAWEHIEQVSGTLVPNLTFTHTPADGYHYLIEGRANTAAGQLGIILAIDEGSGFVHNVWANSAWGIVNAVYSSAASDQGDGWAFLTWGNITTTPFPNRLRMLLEYAGDPTRETMFESCGKGWFWGGPGHHQVTGYRAGSTAAVQALRITWAGGDQTAFTGMFDLYRRRWGPHP